MIKRSSTIFGITFFIYFFINFFLVYIKMSKDLSARYYKKKAKNSKKSLVKAVKIYLKKKKTKNKNVVVINIRISKKIENKN